MIRYFVPYPVMMKWLGQYSRNDSGFIDVPYKYYLAMIRRFMEPVPVDETWYQAAYPGIASAIDRSVFRSAAHHFLVHGYFEGRLPFAAERTDLRLPVPFAEIRAATIVQPARDGLHVRLSADAMMNIVQRLLRSVPVDENWYRQTYPGVDSAISAGVFSAAAEHFVLHGYQECRWPFPMWVDEAWYVARYPDVPHALAVGDAMSAYDHFWRIGYKEGRFPSRAPVYDPKTVQMAAA